MQELRERLDAYMAKKGLRSTNQRRVITESFFDSPKHVTIEELLAQVRERDRRIGYATVYRTLKLFTECGIAAERNFGDGPSRYELSDESTHHHHDHLICIECDKIVEFHDEQIEQLQEVGLWSQLLVLECDRLEFGDDVWGWLEQAPDSTLQTLAIALGLPPEDMGLKHRADYDAAYQAQILKALLETQRRG